jgi:hypothetical protein
MKSRILPLAAAVAVIALVACSSSLEQTPLPAAGPQTAAQAPSTEASAEAEHVSEAEAPTTQESESDSAPSGPKGAPVKPVSPSQRVEAGPRDACGHPAQAGRRECDAIVFSRVRNVGCTKNAPYCAYDLQSAYGFTQSAKTAGKGITVAVVAAYGYPNVASDLAIYRKSMGLSGCSTSSACLKVVNQSGRASPLPKPNADASEDWRAEQALDLDMVSAICPNCKILLVQASSNRNADLAAGVNAAITLGAAAVSNSYSGSEAPATDSSYRHPGRAITASAGNGGTGAVQPCSYAGVVCVGGTSLSALPSGRWTERAWRSTGSGCSAYVAKPAWQHLKGCAMRAESDIAAVADPATGVAVYDSASGGWLQVGGTSVAAPIISAAFALGPSAARANAPQWIWRHGGSAAYRDVVSGSNGVCSLALLCTARAGYDGPTGWGTPQRIGGF